MSLPLLPSNWGPSTKGVPVKIDETPEQLGEIVAIDVETDEKDNFVGGCLYDGSVYCYYYTSGAEFIKLLDSKKLIGWNLKGDLHWLNKIGGKFTVANLHGDAMLMSYCINSTRDSQGLKEVAKDELHWEWPTYRDIVGTGRKKQTLDKQPIEKVAEYCGMDTLATWKLYNKFAASMNAAEKNLYWNIELPVYKILFKMEEKGIKVSQTKLDNLDFLFKKKMNALLTTLHAYKSDWNPNSPKQTVEVLNAHGIKVGGSDKQALSAFSGQDIVDDLLAYRKIAKLHSTYVVAFRALPSLPYIHTTFNQISYQQNEGTFKGIRTGRLSSDNPNLQNIPAKGEGELLREVFIPNANKLFVDADYSQIEYRLLAHFTKDQNLIDGFKRGEDVHAVTGRLLGCERGVGKTLNFASIYGARAEKIAYTAKITVAEAEVFLDKYWKALPKVKQWMDNTLVIAKCRGGVSTMSGRWIPLPDLKSSNKWKRAHAERAAINYIIQGSAADIIKVAMIELDKKGFEPLLTVHDELLFEVDKTSNVRAFAKEVKKIMNNVVQLAVPLDADVHLGYNWKEAKE